MIIRRELLPVYFNPFINLKGDSASIIKRKYRLLTK